MENNWLVIGKIVSTQGIKGEVRVLSYSDFPERFEQPGVRWMAKSETAKPEPIELVYGRNVPGKISLYVLRLKGVETCNDAEALRGNLLMVEKSDRPQLLANEYRVVDLIGCSVFYQPTGQYLGKVMDVILAGNDLLEVENDRQEVVLIPFVEAIAPIVDLEQKRIEILPPRGLVDHWLEQGVSAL